MIPVSFLLLLACSVAGDLSPVELIERLDSPDRVVREEAARTLLEQGAAAMPPLRAALNRPESPTLANGWPN